MNSHRLSMLSSLIFTLSRNTISLKFVDFYYNGLKCHANNDF